MLGGVKVQVPVWDPSMNRRDDPWCLADCVGSGLHIWNKLKGGFQVLKFKVGIHIIKLLHFLLSGFLEAITNWNDS